MKNQHSSNKPSEKMNGAKAFLKTLLDGGVDTVFGCPGTSEMQLIEELGHTDVKAVLALQENVVTGMAHGYGVMADKPSLALLHVACGTSNGLANMHNGRRASAPMVVFAGGVAANHEHNNPEHQMFLRPHQIAAAGADWTHEALTSDLLGAGEPRRNMGDENPFGATQNFEADSGESSADAALSPGNAAPAEHPERIGR